MNNLVNFGLPIIYFLQSLGDGFIAVMKFFSSLGNVEFYLTVLPAIYWCLETTLGIRIGIMLLFSASINDYFKWTFHMPRPSWINPDVKVYAYEPSFGNPSGHAQNAVAIWGVIAARIKQRWDWVAAISLMFLIGISRLALGVHSLIDVLTGWIIGGILLWVVIKFEGPVFAWFNRKNAASKIGVLFGFAMVGILIGLLILIPLRNYQLPAIWVENADLAFPGEEPVNPFNISGMILRSAVFFGLTAGAVWMQTRGRFDPGGLWWKRVLRYPIGVVGVLIIWKGLDLVFPEGETLVANIFYFLRYALVGLWISGGALLVFMKLGLAENYPKQESPT